MIKFSAHKTWFGHSGLFLLCLQLFLFIFCLYPFQSGTWFNTEPAMVALFSLSALSALWLALGIKKHWLVLGPPIHPLLYGLLAWAGLQFFALPTTSNPFHSWMGIPQTGEGGAWHVMLAALTFFAMPLWQVKAYQRILIPVGLSSLCIMAYLHFNPYMFCHLYSNYKENNPATPANFPDYLPFIAGWLWIAYASSVSLRTPPRHFWMVTICCTVIYITEARAAALLIYPMFIAMSIALRLQLVRKKPAWIAKIIYPGRVWFFLAMLGMLLPLCWVAISQYQELFPCKNSSTATHAIFNQAAISTIMHEPSRLFIGNGWGNFRDDMFKYGMVDGLYSFQNGEYDPNSKWLNGTVFHPHNQPLAALFALGIPGFALFMALPLLALLPLRKPLFWWCAPVLIGVNATGVMWFPLPQVLPFQALAFAALCAGRKASIAPTRALPQYIAGICLLLATLLAASSWQQVKMIAYGERLKMIMEEEPDKPGIMEWIETDIPRGGERMAEGILYFAENIAAKVNANSATDNDRDWYRNFLEIAHHAAQTPNAGIALVKLEPELSMLLFRLALPSPLDSLKPQVKAGLVDSIIRLSAKAPQREDFIAPFLMSLDGFTGSDTARQSGILENILKVAPKHRSALWLLGSIYEASPETKAQGFAMKKEAVNLGVERVYPLARQELLPYQ
jgi:hypothetical protein